MFRRPIGPDAYLELLQPHHAQRLFALIDHNRDHLRSWLPWVDEMATPSACGAFIRSGLLQFANDDGLQAGIWQNGTLAGVIGLHSIQWNHRATSVGYWLGKPFEGRGLMTAACGALLDYAFAERDLTRVEVRVATDNARSRAVVARLGFRLEGVVRRAEWLYDHFVDHAVYGMLAEEWLGAAGAPR